MVIPCREWGAHVQSLPLEWLHLPCSKMTEHLTTFSHPWTIKDSCFPALHNPNQLIYLLWRFCRECSVIKCSSSSSALLLLILLVGKRNICLCHGDLLVHSIHGKQRFVASMSLSEILAGFSSPLSIRIENSLTLGFPEKKFECIHSLGIPQIYCPLVILFCFVF